MTWVTIADVAEFLDANHYLGRARRGVAWRDEFGVMVLNAPTSRRLPTDWLEISRWCLIGTENGGSEQYARVRRQCATVSTIVSYSDPSAGHTGALYRACGFGWAPTWHRLREPPSGNGNWIEGKREAVKDRWVDAILPDERRSELLRLKDDSIDRRFPWASWREPKMRRGRVQRGVQGGDFKRFAGASATASTLST